MKQASRPLAIRNARLIDPASRFDGAGEILIRNGLIEAWGANIFASGRPDDAEVIDAAGLYVSPGFIDMRVFTGEPGSEHRETLESASQAAAAGGISTMVVMPSTDPVIDDVALVDFIKRRAEMTSHVRVEPAAALTRGLKGEAMTEIGMLKEAGAILFTDADRTIPSSLLMRRLLSYAANFDALIMAHAEDPWLSAAGAANEGEYAARLGLPGIPAASEAMALERDLRLVAMTGARYHLGQVSTAEALDVIRRWRARGLQISCAVSAHHLALNERDIEQYKTYAKVTPPLRAEADRMAMVEGLKDGTIDAIVSSHDPQAAETKRLPFAQAAYGAIGLETLLGAALTAMHGGGVPLMDVLARLTIGPARILGLAQGRIAKGAPADLTVFDPNAPYRVDPLTFRSRTKNTPFKHRLLQGRVRRTIVAGATVFEG